MQHDLQLRADARAAYERSRLWVDQPAFDEAERLRLPSYLDRSAARRMTAPKSGNSTAA